MTRPTTTRRLAAPTWRGRIYPVVAMITADGFRRLSDAESGEYARAVVEERTREPSGPVAPLPPVP